MRFVLIALLCLFVHFPERANGAELPTDFEFSGTLLVDGTPAWGRYNLEFRAYRTPEGGDPVGAMASLANVVVLRGAYSGRLDFGPGVFTGEPVWVELRYQRIRRFTGPFETSPGRIAIQAVPYAMAANHANTATHASSSDLATTSTFANTAAFAALSNNANTATHATSSDLATTATFAATAALATVSNHANTASHATSSDLATTATFADSSNHANTATHATTSDLATTASFVDSAASAAVSDYATTASFAALANYAESSGEAATATHASTAGHATTADQATIATDALSAFARSGAAYEAVQTTDDPVQNGANLLVAYARAKALTPHGAPHSATNRVTVLLPPATYDLGTGQLVMDTEFVDLVGLSSNRENQYIYGLSNGNNTGVIRQTANNVRIENLKVHCARTGSLVNNASHPAAYFPDGSKPQTSITNCAFSAESGAWSTRLAVTYSGLYTECTAGNYAFGGNGGTASGIFLNCTGGDSAFGGLGTASGTFTNCAGGIYAFGGLLTASGTFNNCTGGDNAFGATASGAFTNCTGGNYSFGGLANATGGRFYYCRGGVNSFGSSYSVRLYCIQNNAALP